MAEEAKKDEEDLSIEEILSSIRDIISEDDEDDTPVSVPAVEETAVEPEPVVEDIMDVEETAEEAVETVADNADDNEDDEDDDDDDDDVMELTDPIEPVFAEDDDEEPSAEPVITPDDDFEDLADAFDEEIEEDKIDDQTAKAPKPSSEGLLSGSAAAASLGALSKLSKGSGIMSDESEHRSGGATLEDITKELLRPLLKEWLDENLPALIEKTVQKEIRRLSRSLDDE